jgi:hypothetical protein
MGIGTMQAWFDSTQTIDGPAVLGRAETEPEIALAGTTRKHDLAEARDFITKSGPSSIAAKT